MQQKRSTLLIALLLGVAVVLTGCGPRAGSDEAVADSSPEELVVALPAIYVDFDTTGTASIGGTPVADLGALAGQDLSALQIDPQWIEYLTATNIQHIHLNNTPEGLMIMVNGQAIPSLGWDGEALTSTASALSMLSPLVPPVLEKVLPLLGSLGTGAVIRFPVADGADLIPLEIEGDNSAAAQAQAAQADYLASVGTPPQIRLSVSYDANGIWTVEGLTADEWSQTAPIPGFSWNTLNLPANVIQGASSAGIDTVNLASNQEGIFVMINGNALPHITWGNGEINHVLDLAVQMGLLQTLLGQNINAQAMLDTVKSLLPAVQTSDVNLTVNFP
ncbi:MAG: hypothetical protein M3Q45_14250 [Chloroflexota bacterium]|nr:hypothetical protein [Chloroflexota bacterium]